MPGTSTASNRTNFRSAQETCSKRPPPGDFFLLPALGDRAFDGRREAVVQDFEDDARRCRANAVDTRQGAGIEQFGERALEPAHGRSRPLVSPSALRRTLHGGKIP